MYKFHLETISFVFQQNINFYRTHNNSHAGEYEEVLELNYS